MNGPPLAWDDVRIFLAIVESGSMTEAAERLGVSQPTVGRRLRALELALGLRLFDRLPHRLDPTADGLALAEAARAMREGADLLGRLAQARGTAPRPVVRITSTSSIGLFLARHAAMLAEACPEAEIDIGDTRARLDLARREADIALRMRRLPEGGDLAARRIGRLAVSLYGSRQHPSDAIVGIGADRRDGGEARWLEAQAGDRPVALRFGDPSMRLEAIATGAGRTLLPCFLGDADPRLVRLTEPPAALVQDIFLLVHADLRATAPIKAVADRLTRLFRDRAAVLEGRS